jgi:hypothetical protein
MITLYIVVAEFWVTANAIVQWSGALPINWVWEWRCLARHVEFYGNPEFGGNKRIRGE